MPPSQRYSAVLSYQYGTFCTVSTRLHTKIVTAAQLRAARALLNWSQNDLAGASLVSRTAIAEIEREAREPYERTMRDLVHAFELAGVEFLDKGASGRGVRFKSPLEHVIDPRFRLGFISSLKRRSVRKDP